MNDYVSPTSQATVPVRTLRTLTGLRSSRLSRSVGTRAPVWPPSLLGSWLRQSLATVHAARLDEFTDGGVSRPSEGPVATAGEKRINSSRPREEATRS
jgi:hypothetical protein